ncbi:MAG: FmdB family transcriptional regulator [Legionella sp. 40-6]|nr:zinc ribbon domain-containing protein [Legionella sp.]OJY43408.1 MAG: FmdB family transcriptional regulator [Legionella sp. 40-6]
MPIYEYQCTNCNQNFDLLQKISDEPIKECPQCHQQSMQKLVSAAGFQLKGTGWYATDFKNKGKPVTETASSDDQGTKKSDTGTSSTSSD